MNTKAVASALVGLLFVAATARGSQGGLPISAVLDGKSYRWFYRVHAYDSSKANGPEAPPILDVVILMDGSVVEPTRQ